MGEKVYAVRPLGDADEYRTKDLAVKSRCMKTTYAAPQSVPHATAAYFRRPADPDDPRGSPE